LWVDLQRLFHQLINLPLKLFSLLRIVSIGWSIRNHQQVMPIHPQYNPPMVACLYNLICHSRIPNHHYPLIWTLWSIMSISLTPKIFNITNIFRFSFRFTCGTSRDLNFSLWWFSFGRNKGSRLPLFSDSASKMMKNPN